MEDNKGCIKAIVGLVVFVAIGELLFKTIELVNDYLAIILMTILGVVFLGFIVMCTKGMKKEKGEDD